MATRTKKDRRTAPTVNETNEALSTMRAFLEEKPGVSKAAAMKAGQIVGAFVRAEERRLAGAVRMLGTMKRRGD
jgi:hypothetical protein